MNWTFVLLRLIFYKTTLLKDLREDLTILAQVYEENDQVSGKLKIILGLVAPFRDFLLLLSFIEFRHIGVFIKDANDLGHF